MSLDMSLDDIIKSKKKTGGGHGRGRGGNRGRSRAGNSNRGRSSRRGGSRRAERRSQPYHRKPQSKTVSIQNLGDDVIAEDLEEILSEVGQITTVEVATYKGRSQGSAKVTFRTASEARKAVVEFDKARVDGRPMFLKIVGGQVEQAPRSRPTSRGRNGGGGGGGRRRGRGGRGRGRGRGGRGRGRGGRSGGGHGRRKPQKEPTAAELDAEMEAYQNQRSGTTAQAAEAEE